MLHNGSGQAHTEAADAKLALLQVTDPATHVQKQILMPSSGEAMPGEIVAIIGPSGAGACMLSICNAFTLYCML